MKLNSIDNSWKHRKPANSEDLCYLYHCSPLKAERYEWSIANFYHCQQYKIKRIEKDDTSQNVLDLPNLTRASWRLSHFKVITSTMRVMSRFWLLWRRRWPTTVLSLALWRTAAHPTRPWKTSRVGRRWTLQ